MGELQAVSNRESNQQGNAKTSHKYLVETAQHCWQVETSKLKQRSKMFVANIKGMSMHMQTSKLPHFPPQPMHLQGFPQCRLLHH